MAKHAKQPILKEITDMNGNKWQQSFVDTYNTLTRDINKTANVELVTGSLSDFERNLLLDQRHRHYVFVAEILATN